MSDNPWSSGTCTLCNKDIADCKCFSEMAVSTYAVPTPGTPWDWYEDTKTLTYEGIRKVLDDACKELDRRKEDEDVEVQSK